MSHDLKILKFFADFIDSVFWESIQKTFKFETRN